MEPLGIHPAVATADRSLLAHKRRRPRLKAHTPGYVSFENDSSGKALDLSEILDVSEEGIAIQAASPLELNQHLNLCLDLSETSTYIHTTGSVVWSDRNGRAGIRLLDLPASSSRQLREWLFLNSLIAYANRASMKDKEETVSPAVQVEEAESAATAESPATEVESVPPESAAVDYSGILIALFAVQREVEALGADLDAALQLVVERAQTFTRASGAAIGLLQGATVAAPSRATELVCSASSGDAPSLGARLQAGTGFSGECLRSGHLQRCDDSEVDRLVDRESCRQLGIRSIVAVPVMDEGTVRGLVEVFSPVPCAFSENDSAILEKLSEIVLSAIRRAAGLRPSPDLEGRAVIGAPTVSARAIDEFPSLTAAGETADLGEGTGSRLRLVLLVTIGVVALVAGVLLYPWLQYKIQQGGWKRLPALQQEKPVPPAAPVVMPKPSPVKHAEAGTLEELRRFAEQGDARAQFAMGAHYSTGDQVKQDYAEAVRWFTKAAEQGNVVAQATLGAYYWAGRGVPQDLNKAYFWSILARAGGDEGSKYRAAVLTSRMTRAQVLAVQQQADEWLKQHQLAGSSKAP